MDINNNPQYYTPGTGKTPAQSMAAASFYLGIGALATCWSGILSVTLASIALVLALLSKGYEKKMLSQAKTAVKCAVAGLIITLAVSVYNLYSLASNPQVILDVAKQSDEIIEQTYGVPTEEVMGSSYEDMANQLVNWISSITDSFR